MFFAVSLTPLKRFCEHTPQQVTLSPPSEKLHIAIWLLQQLHRQIFCNKSVHLKHFKTNSMLGIRQNVTEKSVSGKINFQEYSTSNAKSWHQFPRKFLLFSISLFFVFIIFVSGLGAIQRLDIAYAACHFLLLPCVLNDESVFSSISQKPSQLSLCREVICSLLRLAFGQTYPEKHLLKIFKVSITIWQIRCKLNNSNSG